ncbi:RagB/SusD family nutrient uptake outer membrane protein [Lentimicrobium sp. L6]|uniref:RagB/SusD family nutrient uptake outer membrane protein n=1 Tax=Lentimicrobium sp. L6 TaxID=2735916 RepID=UPI0015529D10|nr:RagB/SusD family nutrient uptake outer membrane protein [Lentimicrobium sp. L6]NPD85668.1 RagB/SusD family nutrient uptake outer membrane protein [Lentimicrobium sp. L6]
MKNIKIISSLFVILLFLSSSCTKLDEKYYDQIPAELYPENSDQVATLSVNAYKQLQNMADDNGWWFLAQEITSDELCGPTRGADWFDGGKWADMHTHRWTNDIEGVNRMWSLFWGGVTVCNQTIGQLESIGDSDDIKAKIAELEVLRAFFYYLLIDNYGDVPYVTSVQAESFLPEKIEREAIYDSLVSTVEQNLKYLNQGNLKYMATKNMAFALLTKLYINAEVYTGTAQWSKANQYCDSVMSGPYSLANDVKSPFVTDNDASPEIIFSIPYDENNFEGFRLHMRTLHYQHNLTYDMPVGPWNGFAVVPTHFDTYEDIDLRKEAHFIWGPQYASTGEEIIESVLGEPLVIDPYLPALSMTDDFSPEQIRTTGARIGKYEIKKGAKENLSNDFPLFRLSDFYLMKAECEIRLGNSGDEWVNPIRTRANVSPYSGCTLDQLLEERGREMFVEGHRRQDLIRFGKWGNSWWEKEAQTAEKEIFPIPQWAIDGNPNLGN